MKLNQKHSPERNASDGDTYFRFLTRKRWKQAALFLACLVVFSTTYALILPAITLEQDTFCETEVHSHNEDCMEKTLICALQETEPDHVHTGECWSEKLICQETEHVHTDECYSDRKADLETADDWQKTLQNLELSGNAAGDSVRIAQSQLGYQESRLNYAVDENNVRHGYSRYNQWFYNLLKQYQSDTGNGKDLTSEDLPGLYDDWSVRFVQFVLTQAGVFTEEELAQRYIREAEERLLEKDTENQSEETQTEQTADHVITDDEALEKLEAQIAWLKNDERFEYIYGMDLDSFQAGDIVIEKAVPDETAAAENEDEQNVEEEKEGEKDAGENQADQKADSSDDSEQAESEQLEADSRSPGIRISMVQEDDFLSARSIGKSAEGTVEQFEIDAQDPCWSLKGVYRLKTDAKSGPDAEDGDKEDGETPDGEETDPSETPEEADGKDEANSSTEKPKQNSELLHSYTYEDDELKIRLALRSKPGAQKDAAKAGAETKTSEDTKGTEEAAHDKEETEVPDYADYQLKIQPVEDASVSEKVEQMLTEQDEVLQSENIFRIVLENGSKTLPLDEYDARVSVQVKPAASDALINNAMPASEEGSIGLEHDVLIALSSVKNDRIDILTSELKGLLDDSGLSTTFSYYGEPLAETGSTVNPKFTVQYYAWLKTLDATNKKPEDAKTLTVIDTPKGVLPKNNQPLDHIYLTLEKVDPDSRPEETKYKVKTNNSLTKIYEDKEFEYISAPSISYFNKLFDNGNYDPDSIWLLKNGGDPYNKENPASENDWKIMSGNFHRDPNDEKQVHFTNRPEFAEKNPDYILITDGTVMRLIFKPVKTDYVNDANFYDYDISDGKWYRYSSMTATDIYQSHPNDSTTAYAKTASQGINSAGNFNGSGTKLAFGNANTGTGLDRESFWADGQTNTPNKTNGGSSAKYYSYNFGATFGLVERYDSAQNKLVFRDGIVAPDLFGTTPVTGKEKITEISQLEFSQVGDTYTLHTVYTNDKNNVLLLDQFNHPQKADIKNPADINENNLDQYFHTHILTNNFWPMDSAKTYGSVGHDFKFGKRGTGSRRKFGPGSAQTFPPSDDGLHHNSYFGMDFAVNFELTEDYVGPLEYYFFGDDDMWVFLDGKLICDIGGVHSSIGEHVNLWDHITDENKVGSHTLNFFYTERGASGSTCFMQFTLPSVSAATPEQYTGNVAVTKEVENKPDDKREYEFSVTLKKDGKNLPDDYSYTRYSADGKELMKDIIINDGGSFKLRNGEKVIINYLPFGTEFVIQEEDIPGITVSNTKNGGFQGSRSVSGTISEDQRIFNITYTNKYIFELPETGGFGNYLESYGIAIAAVSLSCLFVKRKRTKKST